MSHPPEEIQAVPVRHPGRWLAAVVVLVLLAMLVHTLVTNPRFEWNVVWSYFLSGRVLDGLAITILLTVVFPSWLTASANDLITPLTAAILGLGLNEGAYMAEIVRAGILSVEHGQGEAAQAVGMTRGLTMRRVVLQQAMRVIIPPTGNETISMLKTSSLASVITVTELLYAVQLIYSVNFKTIPLLIVAGIWYLIVTSVLTVGQFYVERYCARGSARELPLTPWQRARRYLTTFHAPPPAPALPTPTSEGR